MYRALWRILPGPTWLRILCCGLLLAAALLACHFLLFPLIATLVDPGASVGVESGAHR